MAEPFISEIRMFGFNFAPRKWALCDGQELPINQNQTLFALIGTTFGGNGVSNFALPDMRGRVPVHRGNYQTLGAKGGSEQVTLSEAQLPAHSHTLEATSDYGETKTFAGTNLAAAYDQRTGQPLDMYKAPVSSELTTLNSASITDAGGGLPHENMQPSLVMNFCMALEGVFPSRN
ncbi:phage tail protein [Thalassomonas viridans]|uniref:Phage tail protein n=1 Tax=Thalassomonas viridans TaxID=137584 RepID=A0AAE9Z4K5_9GAMM|nr:tail fiber protein [Thalassomonas viridans]WDE05960.1 phage tail protein [Thalassomonas viridans]